MFFGGETPRPKWPEAVPRTQKIKAVVKNRLVMSIISNHSTCANLQVGKGGLPPPLSDTLQFVVTFANGFVGDHPSVGKAEHQVRQRQTKVCRTRAGARLPSQPANFQWKP